MPLKPNADGRNTSTNANITVPAQEKEPAVTSNNLKILRKKQQTHHISPEGLAKLRESGKQAGTKYGPRKNKWHTPESKQRSVEGLLTGAIKGRLAQKHYTPESKQRQIEGTIKAGKAQKHYSPEGKRKRIEGSRKGGLAKKHYSLESKQRLIEGATKGGQTKKNFTPDGKRRWLEGSSQGGKNRGIHKPLPDQSLLPPVP